MVFIVEECLQKLNSINGSTKSISDVTEWLFNNENDAAKVVQIWSDVFIRASYQTKLYLFYLANNVLVKERNSGHFKYTPEFMSLLPTMCINSLSMVQDPQIAMKILDVLRLWKDHRTMGRSMTFQILSSIPIQIFTQFPSYADLNVQIGNTSYPSSNSTNSASYLPISSAPPVPSAPSAPSGLSAPSAPLAPSTPSAPSDPPVVYTDQQIADMRAQLPSSVASLVQAIEDNFGEMEKLPEKLGKIREFSAVLERIKRVRERKEGAIRGPTYEEKVCRTSVRAAADELEQFYEDTREKLMSLEDQLDIYEAQLRRNEEEERELMEAVKRYKECIVKNNEILDEECKKRPRWEEEEEEEEEEERRGYGRYEEKRMEMRFWIV